MLCLGLVLFSTAVIFEVIAHDSAKIVLTQQGHVEGYLSDDGLYYQFCGIRYAMPVKFRAPAAPPSYEGVYKANAGTVICAQFPTLDILAAPSDIEDCLVLNIYSPANHTYQTKSALPVMVFLHGGDFGVGSGSPSFYAPQYLVSHGVIVVTLNYRLNIYGFLNLGIPEAPGNAGLKDIRAALRWIQANIENFGGNEAEVTVFGQGSGGIAAIYLTMSASTKGLFQRIITQSGSLFSPQSFDNNPYETAVQLAKYMGVGSRKQADLLDLFHSSPVKTVLEAISNQMYSKSVFRPSVEQIFKDEEPFLTDSPINILLDGKTNDAFHPVPMMCGLSTVEGLTCTLDYNTITSQIDRLLNEDYSVLDQRSLTVSREDRKELRKILQETYFGDETASDENVVGGLINLQTDFSYVGPMALLSELYGNKSALPVYEYIFGYMGHRNLGRLLTNTSLSETTNLDELFYLFELERLPLPMDETDARMVTFMTMLWTNFAKYGNPTPDPKDGEWLPSPYVLSIMLEPKYTTPLTPERAYFWRQLFYKYRSGST